MSSFSNNANIIFDRATTDYDKYNDVNKKAENPYPADSFDSILYHKNWIDVVQWHLEDIIRDTEITPEKALEIKRTIDQSNQDRTDLVEVIDSYFLHKYKDIVALPTAKINTESPAWAIDRLSILAIKIFHMREEVEREGASEEHITKCTEKLNTLLEQRRDLSSAIDNLLKEIEEGEKYMKVYKQMKMYNDPTLNPILYGKK